MVARVPALPRGATRGAVAVVTTTAGGAATVVDPLSVRGVDGRARRAPRRWRG